MLAQLAVTLTEGDIVQTRSDALITTTNSDCEWFGGIDRVIQRVAGRSFHDQILMARPLKHAQAIVTKKRRAHGGAFGDVVFVVDDLKGPLRDVVQAALSAVDAAGYATASLPAIRTGVAMAIVEKDVSSVSREIVAGFKNFLKGKKDRALKSVTIVIHDQGDIYDALAYDLGQTRT